MLLDKEIIQTSLSTHSSNEWVMKYKREEFKINILITIVLFLVFG